MCGICGEIRFDGSEPSIEVLQRMNSLQELRGPDAGGELGLGIVFNGCIYNYLDLRAGRHPAAAES